MERLRHSFDQLLLGLSGAMETQPANVVHSRPSTPAPTVAMVVHPREDPLAPSPDLRPVVVEPSRGEPWSSDPISDTAAFTFLVDDGPPNIVDDPPEYVINIDPEPSDITDVDDSSEQNSGFLSPYLSSQPSFVPQPALSVGTPTINFPSSIEWAAIPNLNTSSIDNDAPVGHPDEERRYEGRVTDGSDELHIGDTHSASTDRPPATSFFHGASDVIINGSIMGEHIEVHQNDGPSVLEKMIKYTIPGAEFDSSEREDPPRCHPNTRTNFLQQLQARIHGVNRETKIIWLVGPAGVGKSAIMQSLAEIVSPLSTVACASLFFSRPNNRDDPKKVFTTLAYSFATADADYRRYLGKGLANDPRFLDRSLEEQFKRLFIAPFSIKYVNANSRRWVVLLDGLDECNGEKEQGKIVDLIRDYVAHPMRVTPLIWIIASRPEAHLQAAFRRVQEVTPGFWKLEIPIDSEEALLSVELYLRTEFAKIRRDYSDVVPSLWPSENDFLRLAVASSGLFIFASTLINYIGQEDPFLRLQHILFLITQSTGDHPGLYKRPEMNPFHALDILYTKIMSDIPINSLPAIKTILGFYLLVDVMAMSASPPDLLLVCNILGLEQHAAYTPLRKLHSVLRFPSPDEADKEPIVFLHASFSDFLKDYSRSQSYHIDLDQELIKIWRGYVKTVTKLTPSGMLARQIPLSWKPTIKSWLQVSSEISHIVHSGWLGILIRCYRDPSHEDKPQRSLSLTTSEVTDIFEKLGPKVFEFLASPIGDLFDWLSDSAPLALRQKMVVRELTVAELKETDLDKMFEGLCQRQQGYYSLNSQSWLWKIDLTALNINEWIEAKRQAQFGHITYLIRRFEEGKSSILDVVHWSVLAELLMLGRALDLEERRSIKVLIMRLRPGEQYAIIGPLALDYAHGQTVRYLVFPYAESSL